MFTTILVFIFVFASIQCIQGVAPSYDSICAGSSYGGYGTAGNVWYAAHPTECDKYIQCHVNDYMVMVGEERQCAFSTYWDNVLTSCVGVSEANCPNDPCSNQPDSTLYNANGNCRGYWKCFGKQSVAKCCKIGEMFDSGNGCIGDYSQNCTDFCFDDVVPEPEGCDKRATIDAYYFEQLTGSGWVRMECAPGTSYVQEMCDCAKFSNTPVLPEPDICIPEIYLPFDTDTNDRSGNDNFVLNENVNIRNGSAIFNGNSKLVIPRFNNLDHITSIFIKVRYRSNPSAYGGGMAIVSNSNGKGYSILITEDNSNIKFGCKTTSAYGDISLFLPQDSYGGQTGFKSIVFQLDSGMLTCKNGPASESVKAPGPLKTVKCGLHIGYADGVSSFTGEIDEVKIYLCSPNNA